MCNYWQSSGIFSFILVLILFFLFLLFNNKNYLNRLKFNKNFYNARVFILGSFLISLFPIVPTGSFFTNWLSIIYFLPLGILFYLYDNSSYEKNKIAVVIPCYKVKKNFKSY